jgi:hypothetical protein
MVVSEDAAFIARVQRLMRKRGSSAVGCLGPADAAWLPEGVGIAIVDGPAAGTFAPQWFEKQEVSVRRYAEDLADLHPGVMVVVCGAFESRESGAGGGSIAGLEDRKEALSLLSFLSR